MYTTKKLNDACMVLFGPSFKFSPETLKYIQLSGIKSAYREKSKVFHPDLASLTGIDEDLLTKSFQELNKAYNLLTGYIKKIERVERAKERIKKHNITGKNENFFKGKMPDRELRFGEYLYYRGKITWDTLIKSIVDQSSTRGKIGKICVDKNFININDIKEILRLKNKDEKFGESAVKNGFINLYQLKLALNEQQDKKYPIGRYFIKNSLFTKEQLNNLLLENRKYNYTVRKRSVNCQTV